MAATIIGLNVLGWGMLAAAAGGHYHISGTQLFGFGTGVLAYTLGIRHAFDADHIAAIDNTTRKLAGDGKRPLPAGFFFSLGHSTIVFALAVLLNVGIRALNSAVKDDSPGLHAYTGIIGTSVSGTFLYLIAALNAVILSSIIKVFRQMRTVTTPRRRTTRGVPSSWRRRPPRCAARGRPLPPWCWTPGQARGSCPPNAGPAEIPGHHRGPVCGDAADPHLQGRPPRARHRHHELILQGAQVAAAESRTSRSHHVLVRLRDTLVSGVRDQRDVECRGDSHQLGQRLDSHLPHNPASVGLHRDLADTEPGRDLLVQQAGDDQCHDLSFARRE
jgi:hypothetical protein